MPINNRCWATATIAAAALFAATGVRANPAHPPDDHALFHGAGLGAVDTVPAPGSKGRGSAAFAALDLRGTWAQRSHIDAARLAGNATAPGSWVLTIDDMLDVGSTAFDLDADRAAEEPTVSASPLALATAVPEPDTYALLLAGLAAVGFMARRRQRR